MRKIFFCTLLMIMILIILNGTALANTEYMDTTLYPYTESYLKKLEEGSKEVGTIQDILNNAQNLKEAVEELNCKRMEYNKIINSEDTGIALYVGKTLNVPTFQQETGYYCGPASIKETIHFIKGSSSSQSTYANSMGTNSYEGTYVYKMVQELNKRQSKFTYKYEDISNLGLDAFMARVAVSANANRPIIYHVDTKYLYKYNGVSLGHYITGRGYFFKDTSNNNPPRIYYVDSFSANYGRGNVLGNQSDTFTNMMNSINGNAGLFIW